MLHPLATDLLHSTFNAGLPYDEYVASGKPHERENWGAFHARVGLTAAQKDLVGSFVRSINVLCISGTWCGDCVQQCPMLDRIASCCGKISLRFVDRDRHKELSESLKICGGNRVPVTIFMNEDFEFVALTGDRTLARYRALAAKFLGPACPLPGAPVPADEIAATLGDFVSEFERVHLLLRLSPKLRHRHGD